MLDCFQHVRILIVAVTPSRKLIRLLILCVLEHDQLIA